MTKHIPLYLLACITLLACTNKSPAEKQEEAMAESLAWQRAVDKDTEYHYLKYGDLFPNGEHIGEIEERFDAIDPGKVTADALMARRLTGFVEQFDDRRILSLRFLSFEEDDDALYFECMVNMGPVGKKINGLIEPETNYIQFIETAEGLQMKLEDGRVYVRDDKIILESTELSQYWILD